RPRRPARRADARVRLHGPDRRRWTVNAVVVNEFAKMRHLHVVLLVAVLFAVVTGIGLYSAVFNADFDRTSASSWAPLPVGMGSGFTLAAPLLLAVVASRLVDAENQKSVV